MRAGVFRAEAFNLLSFDQRNILAQVLTHPKVTVTLDYSAFDDDVLALSLSRAALRADEDTLNDHRFLLYGIQFFKSIQKNGEVMGFQGHIFKLRDACSCYVRISHTGQSPKFSSAGTGNVNNIQKTQDTSHAPAIAPNCVKSFLSVLYARAKRPTKNEANVIIGQNRNVKLKANPAELPVHIS
jgi:hypothetical protein